MGENGAAVMQSVTQSGLIGMQMGLAGMQQQHIMAAMLAAQAPGVSNSSGLGAGAPMPGMQVAGRKQRELYVGNLTPGVCTPDLVKQFFTQILTTCRPAACTAAPADPPPRGNPQTRRPISNPLCTRLPRPLPAPMLPPAPWPRVRTPSHPPLPHAPAHHPPPTTHHPPPITHLARALCSCEGYSPTMGPPVACVQLSGEGLG